MEFYCITALSGLQRTCERKLRFYPKGLLCLIILRFLVSI